MGTCTGPGQAQGCCTDSVGTQWGQRWAMRPMSPPARPGVPMSLASPCPSPASPCPPVHPNVPLSPPDPGVPAGHLMRPDFGHQDADDAHKHHEVHLGDTGTPVVTPPLRWWGERDTAQGWSPPPAVSPTATAIRMGQRMIHQTAAFSFLSQHLAGERGSQPDTWVPR